MSRAPRIDMHAHAFSKRFLQELARLQPESVQLSTHRDGRLIALWNKAPLPELVLDERLAAMDAEHVSVEVLSAPPVYGASVELTAELCALMNDEQKAIANAAPGRFLSFVHLPYHDRDAALCELSRWAHDPTVVGLTIASNLQGVYPDASLDWLWHAAIEADLPVFVHPVAPPVKHSPMSLPLLHFPSDTTVFAGSVILHGVLARFPGLRLILAHYGGSLSVLGSRLDMISHPHFPPHVGADLPKPPSSYLRSFYVDTAQGFSRAAYLAARECFGAEHLLYGSDYFLLDTPWRAQLNRFLEQQQLDPLTFAGLLHGNAERVLRMPDSRTQRTQVYA